MMKIMLVEDDKSLREIYGVRLLAEGYDIVSAGDGEEALAMAIKERPGLIVSDVMMPKVSGYDMLDILRSTTETRNIKVIMMTALSSEEQRARAESLGADRYLVKSQVGIEDVVRVVHEVLGDSPATPAAQPAAPAAAPAPVRPVTPSIPVAPPRPVQSATMPTPPPVAPTPPQAPSVPVQPVSMTSQVHQATETPKPASLKTRIIQPLGDPSVSPIDINELLDKELAKEAGLSDDMRPLVATAEQEKALVADQLQQFTSSIPEPTPVEAPEPTAPLAQPASSASPMPTPGISDPTTSSSSAPVTPSASVTATPQPMTELPAVPSINPQPVSTIPTPPPPPAPVVPMQPIASNDKLSSTPAAPSTPNTPVIPPAA